jgi:C-terminal processing protease CtpA/Prc
VPQPVQDNGYTAKVVEEKPESGRRCVQISLDGERKDPNGFGNLMRTFDAAPYRGKVVRFSAAARAAWMSRAQLWLRVDREGGAQGLFDNMGDRPVRSAAWARYEIVGEVAKDARIINLGFMLAGKGKAWFDSATFEVLGEAGAGHEPARPLTERGLDNLVAFTKLLGYVRFFHPSDQAAGADWDRLAVAGMQAAEKAADARELARILESFFRPLAPTVRVFPTGRRPALPKELNAPAGDPQPKALAWRHNGMGLFHQIEQNVYKSERIESPEAKPGEPFVADLGGGVSAMVPLALYADEAGTLPRPPADLRPPVPDKPAAFLPSGNDRATRLADVALAWNVFQHFYPYFDVVKADWPAVLRSSLRSAATDADETAFLDTLKRLVVAIEDGHGSVRLGSQPRNAVLPLFWDWIEDRLVVTRADPEQYLQPGDVILRIDGKPAAEALAAKEALISSATPQWRRHRGLLSLLGGPEDGEAELDVQPVQGKPFTVKLRRTVTDPTTIQEIRPEKIAEVRPGIFYVDISRITDEDFTRAVDRLAAAKGVVFDLRGYPNLSTIALAHLTDKPVDSAQWHVPQVSRPDREGMTFQRDSWTVEPRTPRIAGKAAFLTGGGAISYAETYMGIVEHYKLAEIVGGPTAGTNGNVNPFKLPGGYTVVWTGMKVLKHDGSQHHKVGIQPTVPVSRTLRGVAEGRDEVLEKAIEIVSQ